MTTLAAPMPVPKIVKQYRLWRRYDDSAADYYCVDVDGEDLMMLRPGKPPFHHVMGGFCSDCTFSQFYPKYPMSECTWPECPNRFPNPRGETGWVQGRWYPPDGSVGPVSEPNPVRHVEGSEPAVLRTPLQAVEPARDSGSEREREPDPEPVPVRRGPSLDRVPAVPHVPAHPIANWTIAHVSPAIQSVNWDA
jgi:hypothetical protein